MESPIEKFQRLLRELFQFDCADLDFGIYRIMNHKRDIIEGFIRETLPKTVANELDREHQRRVRASADLDELARRVKQTLGPEAIGPDGELSANYRETTIGRDYLQAMDLATYTDDHTSIEADIYNHLYTFFNRYYQEGDFISKRRYSKIHRYTIPYNGEEVHLHWASSDQYYIKTAEHFRNYDWKAPGGVAVRFELRAANVEKDNVKGDKRFFLPLVDKTQWNAEAKKIVIPFEYRPLTAQEAATHGRQKQQKIVSAAIGSIASRLAKLSAGLDVALLGERRRNGNYPVSHLEHHLRQYTRRNSSDFFIHRDLKGFLSRELDFYLKNEVLNLDEMKHAGEQNAEGWFQKMRLVKAVGSSIIDFLAQIENFQKMLWEKRKFVTDAHYCIAVGSIAPKFYPAIADNQAQYAEWQQLLSIGDISRRTEFMKRHPTLMVDTRHFDQGFVDDLLADFDDLDAATDGLLIHGENWQALRLIRTKYNGKANLIYIDPLYNTGQDGFLYKDNYQHSTWLSMVEQLMPSWLFLLSGHGSLVSHIDEHEFSRLDQLIDMRFGVKQNVGPIIWDKRNPKGDATAIASQHEYLCWAVKDYDQLKSSSRGLRRKKENAPAIIKKAEELIRSHGGVTDKAKNAFKAWLKKQEFTEGEKAYYMLDRNGFVYRSVSMAWPNTEQASDDYFQPLIHPVTGKPCPVPARGWRNPPETMTRLLEQGQILFGSDETTQPTRKYLLQDNLEENVPSLLYFGGSDTDLQNDFGYFFPNPKPVRVGEYIVSIAAAETDSIVLDCFAGSGTTGHAVINRNRKDGGRRKFILAEMGEYFDTVLLPRIKQVTYTPEWKEGKPKRIATTKEAKRSPRVIKCIRLESYEDALNGIEFGSRTQLTPEEKFDDYLLKYMLQWETKESETLLNVEKLASPFSYKLCLHADGKTRIKTIDIPETFNYLLGLSVRSRRPYDDGGRRYLVYHGETRDAPGQAVAVIWRNTEGWRQEDFERDRAFAAEQDLAAGADTAYVNGDSFIPDAKPVEKLFRDRMFAGTGA